MFIYFRNLVQEQQASDFVKLTAGMEDSKLKSLVCDHYTIGLLSQVRKICHLCQVTLNITLDGNSIICKVCEGTFKSTNSATDHIWDKHEVILRNTEGAKPFQCKMCKKRFKNGLSLRDHMFGKTRGKIPR